MTTSTTRLFTNDPFPTITGTTVDGKTVTLPDDADGSWSVLLFYRGHW